MSAPSALEDLRKKLEHELSAAEAVQWQVLREQGREVDRADPQRVRELEESVKVVGEQIEELQRSLVAVGNAKAHAAEQASQHSAASNPA